MTRRVFLPLASTALVLAAGGWLFHAREAAAKTAAREAAATERVQRERVVLDEALADMLAGSRADTLSAFFPARAASLYLQRARSTGDYEDILRAESNARRSLALRQAHNDDAAVTLASSLMGEHRFVDAAAVARDLVAADTSSVDHRALLAEILLERGSYDEAAAIFAPLGHVRMKLSWAPRYARWLELTGRTDSARRVIRTAGEEAITLDHLPRETVAWYYLRMGDLQFRDGHVRDARRAYTEGLEVAPGDHRLLAARAKLHAATGDWKHAVGDAERSLATTLDPAPLAVLVDAYSALGDSARAAESHAALEAAFLHQPGPFHRAMSLYFLDHREHLPEVLAKAREEIAVRQDAYGYDVLAWALHAAGENGAARAAITRALTTGVRDALFHYHAGIIAHASGDDVVAARELREALAINPYFEGSRIGRARTLLDSLADSGDGARP